MARNSKLAQKDRQMTPKAKSPRATTQKNEKPEGDANQTSDRPKRSDSARWTFFSNHAHVLICLYQESEMVLRDIASRVGITERAVQGIIQDLVDAGYVERERVGRRNQYHVIHDMHLRHPIEEHCTVDMLVDVILNNK